MGRIAKKCINTDSIKNEIKIQRSSLLFGRVFGKFCRVKENWGMFKVSQQIESFGQTSKVARTRPTTAHLVTNGSN